MSRSQANLDAHLSTSTSNLSGSSCPLMLPVSSFRTYCLLSLRLGRPHTPRFPSCKPHRRVDAMMASPVWQDVACLLWSLLLWFMSSTERTQQTPCPYSVSRGPLASSRRATVHSSDSFSNLLRLLVISIKPSQAMTHVSSSTSICRRCSLHRQHVFAKIKHPPIVKAFRVTFHRYLPRTSTLILLVTFVGPATLSPSLSSLCLQVFRSNISSGNANMTSHAARKRQNRREKRDAITAAAEANAHDTAESGMEATADDNTGRRAHGKKRSKTDKVAAA